MNFAPLSTFFSINSMKPFVKGLLPQQASAKMKPPSSTSALQQDDLLLGQFRSFMAVEVKDR